MTSKDFASARKVKDATLTELGVVPVCVAPGKEIFGHSHTLIEEVVIVHKGKGKIQIEDDVVKLGAGQFGLYIADVSGHGVAAALLSVHLSRALTRLSAVMQQARRDAEGDSGTS